ncbi:MAG TPA: hypothetical protein DCR43_09020 [Bacteroidales bacterium]|nr:MAG: hypothetical protein A2X11_05145 [Bacteroidetes bacterium GWE2_42_24]OFY26596.1 MAG: hypothetical protein A2X09_03425 [Bacteroidetes bacterium GWF2_43_11]HAQ65974.1 hypothetical protein [Bacteroidales bacterium]HBZ67476.1 hypothetical protein [Bacteroidales bacterium]
MKRTLSLLVIIFISSKPLLAQGEWNNWYLGQKAWLTFQNGSPPTALFNSNMVTGPPCSVISDSAGQLLFYTHGGIIYNRIHQIMLNGNDLHGYNGHN